MAIEDLGILESQWYQNLMACDRDELFCRVSSCIRTYHGGLHQAERDDACRALIVFARAFARVSHVAAIAERLRALYACETGNEELDRVTRACFTDYGAYRTGHGDVDVSHAQTLISQPLGVQKMHARMHHRGRQEALLFTPWAPVVEILCQNPTVQKRDILFMAARRPTQSDLLEKILMSRWAVDGDIRFALASNPYFKVSHALRCATTLNRKNLEALRDSPDIHLVIRDHVKRLLALRNEGFDWGSDKSAVAKLGIDEPLGEHENLGGVENEMEKS